LNSRLEFKNLYNRADDDAYTATPNIAPLSSLSQGDGISARSGNKVSWKHLTFRGLAVPGSESIANHIRMVIIMWHPMSTPTIADIFQSNTYDTLAAFN
jgi:hypothetical protein